MASVPAPLPETANPVVPSPTTSLTESHTILSRELRRLTRVATIVAVLASPSVFYWFHHHSGMRTGKALILTFLACIAFRGMVDIVVRKILPWPRDIAGGLGRKDGRQPRAKAAVHLA